MTKKSIVLWTVFGVVALSAAFGFSLFYNVNRMLHVLNVGDESAFEGHGEVAIFDVKGVIMESDEALKDIQELGERGDVKAVVVRISSPGGAVGPTQEIYDALLRLKTKKKVICSVGDIAASGGYYLAAACDKIYANAGTLTGSIGVVMHFINLKNLYQWAKVEPYVIKAGKFKDIGAENRAMTDAERALLQEVMDDVHGQFKDAVAKARKLKRDFVDEYADGRIFSGAQAKKLGFVDELGGEFEAIAAVAKMAGLKGEPSVLRRAEGPKKRLSSFFNSSGIAPVALQALLRWIAPGLLSSMSGGARGASAEFQIQPGLPYYLPATYLGTAEAAR